MNFLRTIFSFVSGGKAVETKPPFPALAAVLDLGAAPHDLAPAVNLIVARVNEALAADQDVIVMFGEEHRTPTHVRLPELVRQALLKTGAPAPVMAEEYPHNLLEAQLHRLYPKADIGFFTALRAELAVMKKEDAGRYRWLQKMMLASQDWSYAPASHLLNNLTWVSAQADVRLVDAAVTLINTLDLLENDTGHMARIHSRNVNISAAEHRLDFKSPKALHLRNIFIRAQVMDIAAESPGRPVLLQTGRAHVAGYPGLSSYDHSLHRLFGELAAARALWKAARPLKLITVLPVDDWPATPALLSDAAQQALNDPDTILIHGHADDKFPFDKPKKNMLTQEIAVLEKMGAAVPFHNQLEYYLLQNKIEKKIIDDLKGITDKYEFRTVAAQPEPPIAG